MRGFYKVMLGTLLLSVLLFVPSKTYAAKEQPKLNAANKTIWVGESMFDFEVLNIDPDDYKIVYSIKDPDMARINKTTGRVKALSAGKNSTTVVYCRLTNIKTREITNLSTILYVKEKAASVEITNKELADTPLPINGTIDFDSLMYNRAGVATDVRTKYVSDYRVWYSEDPEVAVVDSETGVVTGVAKGTATIWVQTYSSKSLTGTPTAEDSVTVKVSNVMATPTPTATPTVKPGTPIMPTRVPTPTVKPSNVPTVKPTATPTISPTKIPTGIPSKTPTATVSPTVTSVPVGDIIMLSVKQTALKEVTAVFSADVSKIVKKDSFTIKNASSLSRQIIKAVEFSEDGRSAKIKLYVNLNEDTIFTIQYGTQTMNFRSTDGKVASIELDSKDIEYTVTTDLNVRLLDSYGIDVTTADRLQNVVFDYTNGYVDTFNRTITLFQIGDVATVTASYYTYEYDSYGNSETYSTTAVFRAVDKMPLVLKDLFVSVGKVEEGVNWTTRKNFVSVGDDNYYIYAKATYEDGTEARTAFSMGGLTFLSTDTTKLLVNEDTGRMIAIQQGLVEVLIKDEEEIIGTAQIKIGNERYAVSVRPSGVSARISSGLAEDTATFKFTAYDQYGAEFTSGFPLTVTPVTGRGNEVVDIPSSAINNNVLTVSGDMFEKAGVYPYTVTYMDKSFTVNVQVVTPGTARNYRVVVENDGCDVKVTEDNVEDITVNIKVFSYDVSGYKVALIDDTSRYGSENYKFGYTITKLGEDEDIQATPLDGVIRFDARKVSGNTIEQAEAGTYRIVVYVSSTGTQKTRQVMTSTFKIVNTQKAPTLEPCSTTISQYWTPDMLLRSFYINGESMESSESMSKYSMDAVTEEIGSYLWVKSAVIYESYNVHTLVHKIDNLNVTFKME